MPHEPKKRHSRQRQGKRRAAIILNAVDTVTCKNCGEKKYPHTICKNCGYYRGHQFINPNKNTPNDSK